MELVLEFIKQNIFLVGLVVVSGGAFLASLLRRSGGPAISVVDATLLINREDALVLDVRDPAEFAGGHIPEAKNVPLAKLGERISELAQYKDRPIVVVCASGMRSATACNQLAKAGFTQVKNLDGGMGRWSEANLPLTRKKA